MHKKPCNIRRVISQQESCGFVNIKSDIRKTPPTPASPPLATRGETLAPPAAGPPLLILPAAAAAGPCRGGGGPSLQRGAGVLRSQSAAEPGRRGGGPGLVAAVLVCAVARAAHSRSKRAGGGVGSVWLGAAGGGGAGRCGLAHGRGRRRRQGGLALGPFWAVRAAARASCWRQRLELAGAGKPGRRPRGRGGDGIGSQDSPRHGGRVEAADRGRRADLLESRAAAADHRGWQAWLGRGGPG
jgi:hypothetical protein